MNNINKNQNNEDNLKLQCYARFMYNRAERINYSIWLLTFGSIILNFVKGVVPTNISGSLGLIVSIFTIFLSTLLTSTINKAAASRKLFDYNVFQLSNDSNNYNGIDKGTIILEATNKMNRHKKYFAQQMENTGQSKVKGVKNWYVGIDDSWAPEKAIMECQRQNSVFDNKLSKIVEGGILVFLIIAFVVFTLAQKLSNISFIQTLLPFSPFIIKTIYCVIRLKNYNTYYHEQDVLQREGNFNSIEKKQEYIDKRRKMEFFIPNKLYKLCSINIHDDIIESQQHNSDN